MKNSNKEVKKAKFKIEKFEVAKLTNLKKIKGGQGNEIGDNGVTGDDHTITATMNDDNSRNNGCF